MRVLSSRTLASQRERQRQSELRKRGAELTRGRRGQRGKWRRVQQRGGDTHTGSVCVCVCGGREDHGCNAGVTECSIVGGRGVLLLLTPVEWEEAEGRVRRKWRMSGAEKKKKKGWDVLLNKEEQGKGGGKKYLLQEWVRSGDKKPREQNDVSRVPQHFLQTVFPNVCCI